MPVWHELTKADRESGKVAILGVVQEQHAERTRLYSQWQQFDWPIVVDSSNQLGLRAVPMVLALDEAGNIVDNSLSASEYAAFVNAPSVPSAKASPDDESGRNNRSPLNKSAAKPKEDRAQHWLDTARQSGDAQDWIAAARHLLIWGGHEALDQCIKAYDAAIRLDNSLAYVHFERGVALRRRFDSPWRRDPDFGLAVQAWGRALELDPNHYIYRRRIQQYGPRLDKPYPFYDWVASAQRDITDRGQIPIPLSVELAGAEIAAPTREFQPATDDESNPDSDGRITRDTAQLIELNSVVVPHAPKRGDSIRVHLHFKPAATSSWNNEAEPLLVWLQSPTGWTINRQRFTTSMPDAAESNELRSVEFEVNPDADLDSHDLVIRGFALYYVCRKDDGTCLYLRQDIRVSIPLTD